MADPKTKKPRWFQPPFDLKRVGEWISMFRDLAALLFIPFLCLYGALLVLLLWRVFGTADRPEAVVLAVVNFLGGALMGLVILIGLGVLWLQRRNIPSLAITTAWGSATIGSGDAEQAKLAAAAIDAVTPPGAPSVSAATGGPPPPPSKATATAAGDAALAAEMTEFPPEPGTEKKS